MIIIRLESFSIVVASFIFAVMVRQGLIMPVGAHKWDALMESLRYYQETMLQASLQTPRPNYQISFECRTSYQGYAYRQRRHYLTLSNLRAFERLDPNKRLGLLLHGWNEQGSRQWVQDIISTWTKFDPEVIACAVDWSKLSRTHYKSAALSIFDVGLTVAQIIMRLENLYPGQFSRFKVTIAGYSLGAHAAGYAGAVLNGQLEEIIGLDPAEPMFTLPAVVSPTYRLDESDAQFVQVIHTSGGTLGTSLKSGHADFYPNGGVSPQKNCLKEENPIRCSHNSAALFFKESMNPLYPFVGYNCSDYENFTQNKCRHNAWARFGIHLTQPIRGDFYFETEPQRPYVKRLKSHHQLKSHRHYQHQHQHHHHNHYGHHYNG